MSERAWAVKNDQGYWVGIWNNRSTAELIQQKGIHGEHVVEVCICVPPQAEAAGEQTMVAGRASITCERVREICRLHRDMSTDREKVSYDSALHCLSEAGVTIRERHE